MPIEILMPALSPTMTEGNLASWLKKPGDKVEAGEVIAEIETDKATMEVEAVDEGTMGTILVDAGTEGVAVNTPIALLLGEDEDEAALKDYGGGKPADAGKGNGEAAGDDAKREPEGGYGGAAEPGTPLPGTEEGRPRGHAGDSGPAPSAGASPSANGAGGDRVFASPLARRLAAKEGLDLKGLKGSGPHGRIVKHDIEEALKSGKAAPAAAEAPRPEAPEAKAPEAPAAQKAPPPSTPAVPPATDRPHVEVKLTNMRKTVARRLLESKQTIPHFYLTVDCELDALLGLRKQLNERPTSEVKLSVNDFIIKASALALRKIPDTNACWGGDKILRYEVVDVAVAVALEGGLITPVIRDADQKSLGVLSREMKALAEKARAGKLQPEEYRGGSFAISNLGMYNIKDFAAVINPPHGSILAVGAGERRPVVRGDAIEAATVMSVTLSVDHRVIDGALGAEWLKAFKAYVEDPMAMLV